MANHAFCLLTSVVIQVLIPAISIQVSALILSPSLLLHTSSLLRDVYLCVLRIRVLFIMKSDCPESVFRFHWIRYTGVSPLSEISGGWWKLFLLDKVRFPKPPWMSSIFYAFSSHLDRLVIFRLCVLWIVIVIKTNGGRDVHRRCPRHLRSFIKDYDWGKFGLELFIHRSYALIWDYKIISNQTYDVPWIGTHKSSLSYLEDAFSFGYLGIIPGLWISETSNSFRRMGKWDCIFFWKRGHFGMTEKTIVSKWKLYQRLISMIIKSKAGSLFGAFVNAATSTLVMFSPQDHGNFERLSFIFNNSASQLWSHQFGYYLVEILRLHMNIFKYWRAGFNKSWQEKKERVMIAEIYGRLLVVDISNCFLFSMTRSDDGYVLISMKRQDPETFSTTISSFFIIKVMPKAFWSLSSKLLANNKCVKEGHNRLFHLLAWQTSERIAWLLSTLSSKLFQFPIFAYNGCIVLVLYFVNFF